ncbi:MAG: 2Fe-2S iron-sulfur cluster-binding protein, partial [Rhodothermales bacterium]|nr:2Fe-2S iron-sulfur cluster-binding protein [Rhodothermales bacterium]
MLHITFTLNGTRTQASCEPDQHFLDVLRETCGVTSPKDGCSPQGYCGCCTILIDGRPALACLRKASQMEGKDVITLEGIDPAKREALARAFVQEGAVQCGFCTPGIAMRAYALLERDATPAEDSIRRALSGNLCRCTGYTRIVDAVRTAGEMWDDGRIDRQEPRNSNFFGEDFGMKRASPVNGSESKHGVGRSAARYRGWDHTVGRKPYVADMRVEDMLHGAVVLSEYPRATVTRLDASRALA